MRIKIEQSFNSFYVGNIDGYLKFQRYSLSCKPTIIGVEDSLLQKIAFHPNF